MSRCSVGDRLRVIGVPKGRVLLLDAPQLFLGVSAISDGSAMGQHVDGDEEGVAEACQTEHVAVVGDINRQGKSDGLHKRSVAHRE